MTGSLGPAPLMMMPTTSLFQQFAPQHQASIFNYENSNNATVDLHRQHRGRGVFYSSGKSPENTTMMMIDNNDNDKNEDLSGMPSPPAPK